MVMSVISVSCTILVHGGVCGYSEVSLKNVQVRSKRGSLYISAARCRNPSPLAKIATKGF